MVGARGRTSQNRLLSTRAAQALGELPATCSALFSSNSRLLGSLGFLKFCLSFWSLFLFFFFLSYCSGRLSAALLWRWTLLVCRGLSLYGVFSSKGSSYPCPAPIFYWFLWFLIVLDVKSVEFCSMPIWILRCNPRVFHFRPG